MAMTIELEQVVRFLLGEDDIDGHWFGEAPKGKGNYWWRHQLREAWQAHLAQPAPAVDVTRELTALVWSWYIESRDKAMLEGGSKDPLDHMQAALKRATRALAALAKFTQEKNDVLP